MIFTYSAAFYSFVLCSYLLSSCPLAGLLACLYCSLCVVYQKTTLSCTIVVVVALRLHRHKGNPNASEGLP